MILTGQASHTPFMLFVYLVLFLTWVAHCVTEENIFLLAFGILIPPIGMINGILQILQFLS